MTHKDLLPVIKFCRDNDVEMNIGANGDISLYARVSSNDFCLVSIEPSFIKRAIFALNVFRRQGWKSN